MDGPVLKPLRREGVPARSAAPDDDRKMDGDGMILPGGDMPLIRIPDMLEDHVGDGNVLFLREEGRPGKETEQYEEQAFHCSTAAST